MLLNLGTRIRTLRQRDARTQEAVADALGITPQAVSRWEAGGSYPDVEMIPAIANYFHISIDELFGYHDDREERITDILKKADESIAITGFTLGKGSLSQDIYDCVEMLRKASEEFPNEPRILLKLAKALYMLGWHEYGAMGKIEDGSNIVVEDSEYNSKNIYWQEVLRVYEKILKSDPSSDERESTIYSLTDMYRRMGEYEKAKALANAQDSMYICKELLLPVATEGEEHARYLSQSITGLLSHLSFAIEDAIFVNQNILKPEYARQLRLMVVNLYETVFIDGRCGYWHWNIATLYFDLALYESEYGGDINTAITYFDKGFNHFKEYSKIGNAGEYTYSAPLVANMKALARDKFRPISKNYWINMLRLMPKELSDELRNNEKYAECFE